MNPNSRKIYRRVLESREKDFLNLSGCVFDEPFNLRELIAKKPKLAGDIGCKVEGDGRNAFKEDKSIIINDITIEKNIDLYECKFKIAFFISYSGFSKNVSFSRSSFSKSFKFYKSEFLGFVNFWGSVFSGIAEFTLSRFYDQVDFQHSKFLDYVYFNRSAFSGSVNFQTTEFSDSLNLDSCRFSKNVNFYNSIFGSDANFSDSVFSGETRFEHSEFSSKALFWGTKFLGKTYFVYSKFYGLAYFSISKFSGITTFMHSEFSDKTDFTGSEFLTQLYFKNCLFSGEANFEKSIFSGRTTISNVTFENVANFELTIIKGNFFLLDNVFSKTTFKTAAVNGQLLITPNIDKKAIANIATAIIFKHVALAAHNNIAAMNYKACEMELYRTELQEDKNRTELFLLFLNRNSNIYGLSWWRGVKFTALIALIFYPFIIQFGTKGETIFYPIWHPELWLKYIGEFVKNYIDILNILNFSPGKFHENLNAFGTTMFFASRIFISYGIYQTVSAFRKHGRT